MLRQANNRVVIEGILSEVDLQPRTYKRDGRDVEAITGEIKIRTTVTISGVEKELEIPVKMFANKLTRNGTENPGYDAVSRVMNEYVSIAAAGSIDGADRVRITGGTLRMNEYYGRTGKLNSYPQINATFVTKVKKEEYEPKATFEIEMVVASKDYEIDKNGEETGRLMVKGIVPQYNNTVDVMTFYVENENAIDAISSYWELEDTYAVSGKLRFTSKTETYEKAQDWGDPIKETRTINVSELIITGGSNSPLNEEDAFPMDEIREALTERKARIEASKERQSTVKTPTKGQKSSAIDLGF